MTNKFGQVVLKMIVRAKQEIGHLVIVIVVDQLGPLYLYTGTSKEASSEVSLKLA